MGFKRGAPSARFTLGLPVRGVIIAGRMVQTAEYKKDGSGKPQYWEGGSPTIAAVGADGTQNEPKSQLELTIDTGVPDDNGNTKRRIYVKNKRQWAAFWAAMERHPDSDLMTGGIWSMTWTGTEPGEGSEEAKTWAMDYEPGAGGTVIDSDTVHLIGGGTWVKGQSRMETSAQQAEAAVGITQASFVNGPATPAAESYPQAPANEHAIAEALARIQAAHASSPVLQSMGIAPPKPAAPDEPPF